MRLSHVRMENTHTGEEVLVAAKGVGAEKVRGGKVRINGLPSSTWRQAAVEASEVSTSLLELIGGLLRIQAQDSPDAEFKPGESGASLSDGSEGRELRAGSDRAFSSRAPPDPRDQHSPYRTYGRRLGIRASNDLNLERMGVFPSGALSEQEQPQSMSRALQTRREQHSPYRTYRPRLKIQAQDCPDPELVQSRIREH
jgi:hypothetical protein